jgi:hypothetical protein
MKFTSVIIFILAAVAVNSNAQTYTDKVNDQEIADFFAWRMNPATHRVNETITQWDSARFYKQIFDTTDVENKILNKEIQSLFTAANKQFIFQQIHQLQTKKIWHNATLFKDQKLIKPKPLNEMKKGDDYAEFSVPVFTIDKQYCFVMEAYVCGQLCENWSTLLYKRMPDGKWKLYKTISTISS